MNDYEFTMLQGNFIMGYDWASMPAKLGTREITWSQRSSINKKIGRLMEELEEISPIYQERFIRMFGPEENWIKKAMEKPEDDDAPINYKYSLSVVNSRKIVKVKLSAGAREGLYWLLVLWSHPEAKTEEREPIPYTIGAGQQNHMVWDVARTIKRTQSLSKEIGLDKNDSIEVKDDVEEVEEKAEEVEGKVKEPVVAQA